MKKWKYRCIDNIFSGYLINNTHLIFCIYRVIHVFCATITQFIVGSDAYMRCYRMSSPPVGWRFAGAIIAGSAETRNKALIWHLTQLANIHFLHAGWEFLLPVLCWDPRPLELQLLFDVLLLALLEKGGVPVAGGRHRAQHLAQPCTATLVWRYSCSKWLKLRCKSLGGGGRDTHWTVRHSFNAAFCSRHLSTMKKPDSLQQLLKAGQRWRQRQMVDMTGEKQALAWAVTRNVSKSFLPWYCA